MVLRWRLLSSRCHRYTAAPACGSASPGTPDCAASLNSRGYTASIHSVSTARGAPPMSSPSQSHPAPPEGPSGLRSKIEQYLGVALLLLLLLGCFLVMLPFISALLWATILAFSLWPLYDRLVRWLRGRRTLAAALL